MAGLCFRDPALAPFCYHKNHIFLCRELFPDRGVSYFLGALYTAALYLSYSLASEDEASICSETHGVSSVAIGRVASIGRTATAATVRSNRITSSSVDGRQEECSEDHLAKAIDAENVARIVLCLKVCMLVGDIILFAYRSIVVIFIFLALSMQRMILHVKARS
jgi:hypothetical protein